MRALFSKLPLLLLSLFTLRLIIFGASVGDAIALISLAGFASYKLFIKEHRSAPISEDIYKEIAELKSNVNALKVARTLGR